MSQAAVKHVNFVQEIELAHHWFVADQMRISQVLINLLENAICHSHSTKPISLTVVYTENDAVFSIKDNGVGLNSYEIKHIFHTKCYNISYISQANSLPHKAFEKLLIKAELSKDMILSYLLF